MYAKCITSPDGHGSFTCEVQYVILTLYGSFTLKLSYRKLSYTIVEKYFISQAMLPCPVRRSYTTGDTGKSLYTHQKSFEPLALYSLYLKLSCIKYMYVVNEWMNEWNNTKILYGYVETNTRISYFNQQLFLKFKKIHIFPKILQIARKINHVHCLNSSVMSVDRNYDKACIILLFYCYNRGIESNGTTHPHFQKS